MEMLVERIEPRQEEVLLVRRCGLLLIAESRPLRTSTVSAGPEACPYIDLTDSVAACLLCRSQSLRELDLTRGVLLVGHVEGLLTGGVPVLLRRGTR
jgi:hypothetical protein